MHTKFQWRRPAARPHLSTWPAGWPGSVNARSFPYNIWGENKATKRGIYEVQFRNKESDIWFEK